MCFFFSANFLIDVSKTSRSMFNQSERASYSLVSFQPIRCKQNKNNHRTRVILATSYTCLGLKFFIHLIFNFSNLFLGIHKGL